LRLRVFNGVASALLVIFNAAIAVWPMVALNVTLTAINVFYIVRLLRRRHDSRTLEVVEISPKEAYLKHLLNEFDADIQYFNTGFSGDDAARTDLGFLILTGAETVGLVLARNAGDGSAQVDLDYVAPRYQGFTLDRHRRAGRQVDRSAAVLGEQTGIRTRQATPRKLRRLAAVGTPLHSSAGGPGFHWSARWLIVNGRPPRRSAQREANREDVLLSGSFIPSGARNAEHLLVSYRRRRPPEGRRCGTPST
jgi:hypothetical protein